MGSHGLDERGLERDVPGNAPWDLGGPDPVLLSALDERNVRGLGRAIDLGCGTGDNAIELARRGFDVVGVDLADRALSTTRVGPGWFMTKTKSVVLAPDELQRRLGGAFSVTLVSESIEPVDDRLMRVLGLRRVRKASYWLTRTRNR